MNTRHKTARPPQATVVTAILALALLPACLNGSDRPERAGSHARPQYAGDPSLTDASLETPEDTSLELALPSPLHMDLTTLTFEVVESPFSGEVNFAQVPPVYSPQGDFHGSDSFTYVTRDGAGRQATASVHIEVLPVNDIPTASNFGISVEEDGLMRIDALNAAHDVDGDPLAVVNISEPILGTAIIEDDGTLLYVPGMDQSGEDLLSFTVADPGGLTTTAEIQILVAARPDPPVANEDSASLDEDTSVEVDVLENDTDADGDSLHLSSLGPPEHGSLEVTSSETIRYTPVPNFFGTDSFTYIVEDDTGLTAEGTVVVTVLPVNDSPVASDVNMTISYNVPTAVPLSATDIDGDPLSFTIVGTPQFGSLATVISNGPTSAEVTFLADELGTETLSLRVSDGHGGVDIAAITLDLVGLSVTLTGSANTFDTDSGELNGLMTSAWNGVSLRLESFIMPANAALRITGGQAFEVEAEGLVLLSGLIDASGEDAGGSTLFSALTGSGLGTSAGPGGGAGGVAGGPAPVGTGGVDGGAGLGQGGGGAGLITGMFDGCSAGGGGGSDSAGLAGGNWNGGYGGAAGASFDALGSLVGGSGGGGGSVEKDSGYGLSSLDDAGAAGGGGGGAVSILSNGNIMLYPTSIIDARGGDGGNSIYGSGGGGGGGGVIEISTTGSLFSEGEFLVSGGLGGNGYRSCDGGSGGHGIVELVASP